LFAATASVHQLPVAASASNFCPPHYLLPRQLLDLGDWRKAAASPDAIHSPAADSDSVLLGSVFVAASAAAALAFSPVVAAE
jgi:hypothetical protein